MTDMLGAPLLTGTDVLFIKVVGGRFGKPVIFYGHIIELTEKRVRVRYLPLLQTGTGREPEVTLKAPGGLLSLERMHYIYNSNAAMRVRNPEVYDQQ